MLVRLAVIAAALLASTGTAFAADAKRLGKYGEWESLTYTEGNAKVCYIATTAAKVTGGEKGKNTTFLIVTHRPGSKSNDEVSINATYTFKKDSSVELQVGALKHSLFTKGERAWAADPKTDKAIIATLQRGKEAILHASPAKGSDVAATFPLSGFSDALASADKACNIKR